MKNILLLKEIEIFNDTFIFLENKKSYFQKYKL